MEERKHSGTGLFMTELILVILFFSIAASCCLQAFARSARIHRQSEQLKAALNSTENLVQQLKSLGGDLEGLSAYYPQMSLGEEAEVYFDQDGISCGEETADYEIFVTALQEDGVLFALLESRTMDGEEIYTLQAPICLQPGEETRETAKAASEERSQEETGERPGASDREEAETEVQ